MSKKKISTEEYEEAIRIITNVYPAIEAEEPYINELRQRCCDIITAYIGELNE